MDDIKEILTTINAIDADLFLALSTEEILDELDALNLDPVLLTQKLGIIRESIFDLRLKPFPEGVDAAFEVYSFTSKCPNCGWVGGLKETLSGFNYMRKCPQCFETTEFVGTSTWDVEFLCWPENQVPF